MGANVGRGAALALAVAAVMAPPPAAAGGSFQLCYERLKQLAALYEAQGSPNAAVVEPEDVPDDRRYVLELRIGPRTHRFRCTSGGTIERLEDE